MGDGVKVVGFGDILPVDSAKWWLALEATLIMHFRKAQSMLPVSRCCCRRMHV